MKGNKGRQKNPSFKPVQYIDKRLLRAIFLIRRHFGRQIYVHCIFSGVDAMDGRCKLKGYKSPAVFFFHPAW